MGTGSISKHTLGSPQTASSSSLSFLPPSRSAAPAAESSPSLQTGPKSCFPAANDVKEPIVANLSSCHNVNSATREQCIDSPRSDGGSSCGDSFVSDVVSLDASANISADASPRGVDMGMTLQ